jgi:hypothetical protein
LLRPFVQGLIEAKMSTGIGIRGSIENSGSRAPLMLAAAVGGLMLVLPSVPAWGTGVSGATHSITPSDLCGPLLKAERDASSAPSAGGIVATALERWHFANCPAYLFVRSDDDQDSDNNGNDDADDSDDPGAADWQVTPTEVVEA